VIRAVMLAAAAVAGHQAARSWQRDRALNGSGGGGSHRLEVLAAVGARLRVIGLRVPAPPYVGNRPLRSVDGAAFANPDDVRAGSLAVFGVAGLAAALTTGSVPGVVAAAGCLGFGWAFPDLWFQAAAHTRAEQIERQAPLALDLIASAVTAGIAIDPAMELAAEVSTGPLQEEIQVTLANLRLGHRRHAELTDLAERTSSPSLRRLASALRMSDRLGVPLADVLRRQAARARVEQTRRTHERAARASPRILLVVVFLLVPAAVLPVMTALALVAAQSIGPVIDGGM
jgi:tight adherence protein C